MELIVDLLRPFQEATEILSAEKYVTISFVVPFFEKLKEHLAAKDKDNQMIKDMKKHMLLKLNNKYTESQFFFKYLLFIGYLIQTISNNKRRL